MPTLTRRRATHPGGLDAVLPLWRPVLDAIETNVFVADLELRIVYANPRAHRTLQAIDADLQAAFGIRAGDIVGGSIHRFHRDPARVEGILAHAGGHTLPHVARFSFGSVMLDSDINVLRDLGGADVGYVVNWEDITDLARSNDAFRMLSSRLGQAATSVEEVGASIREVARNAADAATTAAEGVAAAESARALVEALGARSSEIGEVVRLIDAIAQQTNLLALNATIEAARAGEAGRGFAVVAGEVKQLARGTSEATDDIGAKVEAIQRDVDAVIAAIVHITEVIGRISDYQGSIAGAVEQQGAATSELAMTVGDAARGSEEAIARLDV
jgi:uncharacterized protein YoxC